VTPPEQRRFTPKQAVELSAANGEDPAGAVGAEGTRRFVAGKEVGRISLLTFFGRAKKVRRRQGTQPLDVDFDFSTKRLTISEPAPFGTGSLIV